MLWLAVVFALTGLTGLTGAAGAAPPGGGSGCLYPYRLYAVAAGTGHLTELVHCRAFEQATVVDHGDWRGHRSVFATRADGVVTVYALTANDELLSYRQPAPNAGLEAPVRIEGSWADRRDVFASGPGVLHARTGGPSVPVDTFVLAGTSAVRQSQPLLPDYRGVPLQAVHSGQFAEANVDGLHLRVWRTWRTDGGPSRPVGASYPSGALPVEVTGVAGSEFGLFGVDELGRVAQLRQQRSSTWDCEQFAPMPWLVVARSTGSYARVVVPMTGHEVPTVAELPAPGSDCPDGGDPWEWQ